MIQPINGISFSKYSTETNFKAKGSFTGFYDPACSHLPKDAAPAMDTLGTIAHKTKQFVENIKDKISSHADDAALEIPNEISKTIENASGLKMLNSRDFVNETTGVHTHVMPDGTPYSYTAATPATADTPAPEIDLPSNLKPKTGLTIIDSNNVIEHSTNTLMHNTGDGTVIPIQLDPQPVDTTGLDTTVDLPDFTDML